MTVRFTIAEKLEAVETAIVSFRWARSEPETTAGQTYERLKELASELRDALPDPSTVVLRS